MPAWARCRGVLAPGRLGGLRRFRASLVGRKDADHLAVLPLADRPRVVVRPMLLPGLAPDGLELAPGDSVAQLRPVDLAPRLDRLLRPLQAAVDADRARLRVPVEHGAMRLVILLQPRLARVDAAVQQD